MVPAATCAQCENTSTVEQITIVTALQSGRDIVNILLPPKFESASLDDRLSIPKLRARRPPIWLTRKNRAIVGVLYDIKQLDVVELGRL